jgi:predicted dehydrogenase
MDTIRICMIGAGQHASAQLYPCFPRLGDATVVANCDLDLARARTVGARYGITRHYDDWRTMLAAERPQGVIVCAGDRIHAELAPQLMAAGCHVLVEKPHAPDLAASQRMLDASRATEKVCMGAYKKRYTPAYQKALAAIRDPAFGTPCLLNLYRAMGGKDQADPGYLWQWGCHAIDLLPWLLGPVAALSAQRAADDWRAVTASLRFASGAVGTLTLASPGGNWEELTVLGAGMAAVRVRDGLYTTVFRGNEPCGGHHPSFAASNDGARLTGFQGELDAFVAACRGGERPDADITRIHHTLEIHAALRRAIDSGRVEEVVPCA